MNDLHTGAPEPTTEPELFVEFANTARLSAEPMTDDSHDAEVLAAWLDEHGLPTAGRSRVASQLSAFRDLRALVREVAARLDGGRPPTTTQIAAINRVLREGPHYHALRTEDGGAAFSVMPVGDELDQARSAIAGSLAHYLADHDLQRLRVCADDTCRWLFVDRSPAGRRRWCDMRTCGNRAKVARHRARARASA
jgi:predicted RNA-binding Zn ribbon-like protein